MEKEMENINLYIVDRTMRRKRIIKYIYKTAVI